MGTISSTQQRIVNSLVCAFAVTAGWLGGHYGKSAPAPVLPPACPSAAPARSALADNIPPPPAPSASSAPAASASASSDSRLEPVEPWPTGIWISAINGDAIPDGPTGGKVVSGGARFVFTEHRPGSKTPWNVTFWVPRSGHLDNKTISGACGYYRTGTAYCKGYGLEAEHAVKTMIDFQHAVTPGHLLVTIGGDTMANLVREELVRK